MNHSPLETCWSSPINYSTSTSSWIDTLHWRDTPQEEPINKKALNPLLLIVVERPVPSLLARDGRDSSPLLTFLPYFSLLVKFITHPLSRESILFFMSLGSLSNLATRTRFNGQSPSVLSSLHLVHQQRWRSSTLPSNQISLNYHIAEEHRASENDSRTQSVIQSLSADDDDGGARQKILLEMCNCSFRFPHPGAWQFANFPLHAIHSQHWTRSLDYPTRPPLALGGWHTLEIWQGRCSSSATHHRRQAGASHHQINPFPRTTTTSHHLPILILLVPDVWSSQVITVLLLLFQAQQWMHCRRGWQEEEKEDDMPPLLWKI